MGPSGLRAVMICLFKSIRANEPLCSEQLPLFGDAGAVGPPSDNRDHSNSHNVIAVELYSENIECGLPGKGLCFFCGHSLDVREWLE